nr:FtsX-like permease family protein [uncultured Parabacteroides sp.]
MAMVSRTTAEKLALILDWKEGVVGKKIYLSGHGMPNDFEILGVYDDVRVGAISSEIMSPTVLFYSSQPGRMVSVKLHKELTVENMKLVEQTIKNLFPDKDITIASYDVSIKNLYSDSRLFRNSIMLGGIVTFLITLIGLIGYISDETNRRSKEIAIRKINGATVGNILVIISKDVLYMAVPAVIFGVIGSYIMGENWLQQFSEKIPLSVFIFVGSALAIWLLVLATVVLRTWEIANDNPVKSLKSE